jgi:hypothetical protein
LNQRLSFFHRLHGGSSVCLTHGRRFAMGRW